MTDDIARFNELGVCEFCEMHDRLEQNSSADLDRIIEKIKKQKGYQALVGISGGHDSSYLLWWAVSNGIKVLALHFDNGYNTPEAEFNMSRIVHVLGVDLVRIYKDDEYDLFVDAFRYAGTPDADIPNDMYMADIMQTTAHKYEIKYILNGHDYRTEGSTPIAWTYMDARYMVDVFRYMFGRDPKTPHIQTFGKQVLAALRGIKHIRPFHYYEPTDKDRVIKDLGLVHYGVKHGENTYTKWVGYDLLPNKFGIDKRIVYLSAQMRSWKMTRQMAVDELKEPVEVADTWDYDDTKTDREFFSRYNFRRWRWLIWLMMKLNLTSYNFYKKYTQ
jgi:hypothetical protein